MSKGRKIHREGTDSVDEESELLRDVVSLGFTGMSLAI
jgi:hypothetical protein